MTHDLGSSQLSRYDFAALHGRGIVLDGAANAFLRSVSNFQGRIERMSGLGRIPLRLLRRFSAVITERIIFTFILPDPFSRFADLSSLQYTPYDDDA